jgi:hypothetical protein
VNSPIVRSILVKAKSQVCLVKGLFVKLHVCVSRVLSIKLVAWHATTEDITKELQLILQHYLHIKLPPSIHNGATDARAIAPKVGFLTSLLQAQDIRLHRQCSPWRVHVVVALHSHHIMERIWHLHCYRCSRQDVAHLEPREDER